MPVRRDLELYEYGISENAYREMIYFCRQYNEMKERLARLYDAKPASITKIPKGNVISDNTANSAIKAERLSANIDMIEKAAKNADSEINQYILKNVCNDIGYNYLRYTAGMPCSRTKFYKARRKFFYNLYEGRRKMRL